MRGMKKTLLSPGWVTDKFILLMFMATTNADSASQ